jgi:hypothetical protein
VFNNIVLAADGRALLRMVPEAAEQNNSLDYNDYFSLSALRLLSGDKESADFKAFRKASGQEAHGFAADPRLRDAGKGGVGRLPLDAYRLLPDSPCLHAGTEYSPDLGALDYWGKALLLLKRLNIGPEQ